METLNPNHCAKCALLKVEKLSKKFPDFFLDNVSFEIQEGEYFILLGPSGVGKTVLLELITGLSTPDSGRIFLDDCEITNTGIQERRIGMVYQDQMLFPHLTVKQNIAYGLNSRHQPREETGRTVAELADQLGVSTLLDRLPESLSGGERQRVALARVLAIKPRCLLLDEPLSALDPGSRSELRRILRKIHQAGNTIVHVTHDYEEAVSLAQRIAVMDEGRIIQTDLPEEVFLHPRSAFVARFVGIRNFYHGELKGQSSEIREFQTCGKTIHLTTVECDGPGFIMIASSEVTLSSNRPDSSARNVFEGVIIDIAPVLSGIEVMVEAGFRISALITRSAREEMHLSNGAKVWVSIKATAVKYYPQ
ncbi:MAG: ABC transporter ATP-binding protein [Candidatus Wallbacteria bacterium]|nr:ABC transporter ATP-binding protein [Candidatus Wallbacteria bacterium]